MFQLSHQLSDVVFKTYIDWNGIIVSVNLQKQFIFHSYIFQNSAYQQTQPTQDPRTLQETKRNQDNLAIVRPQSCHKYYQKDSF